MRLPCSCSSSARVSRFQGLMTSGFSQMACGAHPQGEADVGVVQVVGRADRDVVHALFLAAAAQLLDVAVEALELAEVAGLEEVAVQHAHRIVGVAGADQVAAHVLDGGEMSGGDVASHSQQGEIHHVFDRRRTAAGGFASLTRADVAYGVATRRGGHEGANDVQNAPRDGPGGGPGSLGAGHLRRPEGDQERRSRTPGPPRRGKLRRGGRRCSTRRRRPPRQMRECRRARVRAAPRRSRRPSRCRSICC